MSDTTWTPARISALRRTVGENTTEFAAKLGRSPRTVENWEQGRTIPDPLVERLLTARARRILNARKKAEGVPVDQG